MKWIFFTTVLFTASVFLSCKDDKEENNPSAETADYTQIVINELNGAIAGTTSEGKFIELYNKGTKTVPLKGMMLFKDISPYAAYTPNGTVAVPYVGLDAVLSPIWIGPDNMTLAPGAFVALTADVVNPVNFSQGLTSGFSAKKSVQIILASPARVVVDVFTRGALPVYPAKWGDESLADVEKAPYADNTAFARCPDGTGAFKMAASSKGRANPASSLVAIP